MYMDGPKYYVAGHGSAGEVYSLDKLICTFKLHSYSRERNGGQRLLDAIAARMLLHFDHWESHKIGTYRDQFSIKCPDGESFFLGVGLNGGGLPDNTARIEFNPNKVAETWEFQAVWSACWEVSGGQITIKQYDLAIDLPERRENVTLEKDGRLYEERRRSDADRTQYLGQRNAPGRCKLYNKQLETGLPQPLTRLELTLAFEDSPPEVVAKRLPRVTVAAPAQTSMELPRLNDTDLFILTTLAREPERLCELGRRKRETLRPWLDLINRPVSFDRVAYGVVWRALLDFLAPRDCTVQTPYDNAFLTVEKLSPDAPEWMRRAADAEQPKLTESGL